jgi:hypothetical protein
MSTNLAERIASLSPEKRELLLKSMKAAGLGRPAEIVRRPRSSNRARTSFAQQRLWFLAQLDPGSCAYNMSGSVRLRGLLDVAALQRTLSEIARRHEALRTTFLSVDDDLYQVIGESTSIPLRTVDLGGVPEGNREAEASRLATADANTPFDLQQGPLLRATLLWMGEEEHALLLTMHHIVSDGWSVGVLLREIAVLYEAFAGGRPSPLPDLPVQYADFAEWQREYLQGEVLQQHVDYWRRHLGPEPPALDLPTDFPRTAVLSDNGGVHVHTIGEDVTAKVQELCRREQVTLFAALLAGISSALYCRTGRSGIVVGTDIANRNRVETEGLIGFFINQLVLRTDFDGNPVLREVVARARETVLGAYAHQDLPFDLLVREINPKRDLGRTPLFQVKFVLQNAPSHPLRLKGVRQAPLRADRTKAKFELLFNLQEVKEQLVNVIVFNADLFKPATVARLGRDIEAALAALATTPELPVDSLKDVLAERERRYQAERQAATRAALRQRLGKSHREE